MLTATYAECHTKAPYAECRNAECHYAKCRYAACHVAECRSAECRYAECHGATKIDMSAPAVKCTHSLLTTFFAYIN